MVKLGVNIDHIATLRQARKELMPDIVEAARVCERSGCDSITVHLREDRRHIQDSDVFDLRKSLRTKFNLEMSIAKDIVEIALNVKPDYVCIVPEKRMELTTEGGLDVGSQKDILAPIVEKLKKQGIKVSLFIDPAEKQVEASGSVKADFIEIHTGRYAEVYKSGNQAKIKEELDRIKVAAAKAVSLGLVLNAGHGLDYKNVAPVAVLEKMNELNIGFSIIARAVFVGLEQAVHEMKELIK